MSAKKKDKIRAKTAEETGGNDLDDLQFPASDDLETDDGSPEREDLEADADSTGAGDLQSAMVEIEAEHLLRLETEAKESYDKYLRAVAEFENYKKRMIRERADLLKYAGESMARDLLDVLDDLERAIAAASEEDGAQANSEATAADFVKGVKLIKDRFVSIFDKHGIKGEPAVGQPFDPNTHQALASVPVPEVEPNLILEEFKKAYYFKDKLLRVGQAVVSAAPIE